MRCVGYILLALTFALMPVRSYAAGIVFAGFNCRQTLPCDQSDPAFPDTSELMAMANTCVVQNTGFPDPPNGFFDESGVDGSGCFKTKPDAFTSLGSQRSIPQCCISGTSANNCHIQCTMVSQ